MRCNTPLMNSWHSFSPNGRWLVFSSKSRSPYTQMYLTHIDEQGNDSPAILIDNATAANRAVNIPEFVNIPPDGMVAISTPAVDMYKKFDHAAELGDKGQNDAAIAEWRELLATNPDDARIHNNLGTALTAERADMRKRSPSLRRRLELNPQYHAIYYNLGRALLAAGRPDEAILTLERLEHLPRVRRPPHPPGSRPGRARAESMRPRRSLTRLWKSIPTMRMPTSRWAWRSR